MACQDRMTTRPPLRTGIVWAAALAVLLSTALARPASASPEAVHVVSLFSRLCYETMPDMAAAEAHVGDDWTALDGKALEAFRPAAETTKLKAWTFSDGGGSFSFALSQSPMDEQGKTDFPAFADATNVSCSLVLNATEAPPPAVRTKLAELLEREPDETYDEDPFKVSAWTGEAEGLLVVLYYYEPQSGAPGGVLAMTVFVNP